jgi:hypothetical protein
MCSLRRIYVQLYADSLLRTSITESKQLRDIEDKVDLQVLLLWRFVEVHASDFKQSFTRNDHIFMGV